MAELIDKGVLNKEIESLSVHVTGLRADLRKSNTEPIIRIYSEAKTMDLANKLAEDIKNVISTIIN